MATRRLTALIEREGDGYVALCPEVEVASQGNTIEQARANLQAILEKVRAKNPAVKVVLAGMRLPSNLGAYATDFAAIYPALAEKNQATLIPFLLEGVGAVPALNQPDGIHPTAPGHAKVAETVWPALKPLLTP
jgi:acyl-CoA thioesterase-1